MISHHNLQCTVDTGLPALVILKHSLFTLAEFFCASAVRLYMAPQRIWTFCVLSGPSTSLALLVQSIVSVGTVWSVSCLLLFYSRCRRVQPLVKIGARAPVPHGLGPSVYIGLYIRSDLFMFRKCDRVVIVKIWKPLFRHTMVATYNSTATALTKMIRIYIYILYSKRQCDDSAGFYESC